MKGWTPNLSSLYYKGSTDVRTSNAGNQCRTWKVLALDGVGCCTQSINLISIGKVGNVRSSMSVLQSKDDNYSFISVMGKGTFGEVRKAWKRSTGELVAIKIIEKNYYKSYIIKNELKLLEAVKKLDSEESHIVHFIEYFQDQVNYYLVFELLHENLLQYQKKMNFAPVPVRHIRTMTLQILEALIKLKEICVIHADLKPENIMLVDHNRYPFKIKVVDFGSAGILNEVAHVKEPYIQSRFYRAPEILLGLPFDEKVDMWSLGCVLAELHLGYPLYPGNNEYDQIRYICDMQGLPQNYLLDAGSKSLRFFECQTNSNGDTHWRIKTMKECQLKTNRISTGRRVFLLKSLDQIGTVNISKSSFPDLETIAEYYDLQTMVDLIKKILVWDSHKRITAIAAMKHQFISLQHLNIIHRDTRYYQLSRQCPYETTKNTQQDNDNFPSAGCHYLFCPNDSKVQDVQNVHVPEEVQKANKQMTNLHAQANLPHWEQKKERLASQSYDGHPKCPKADELLSIQMQVEIQIPEDYTEENTLESWFARTSNFPAQNSIQEDNVDYKRQNTSSQRKYRLPNTGWNPLSTRKRTICSSRETVVPKPILVTPNPKKAISPNYQSLHQSDSIKLIGRV